MKAKPKEYTLKELGDVKLILNDVQMGKEWETKPGFDSTYYTTPEKITKPCSFCGKHNDIVLIQGVQLLGGGDTRTRLKVYHQTLYLVCKSCATAKEI